MNKICRTQLGADQLSAGYSLCDRHIDEAGDSIVNTGASTTTGCIACAREEAEEDSGDDKCSIAYIMPLIEQAFKALPPEMAETVMQPRMRSLLMPMCHGYLFAAMESDDDVELAVADASAAILRWVRDLTDVTKGD
jgi:hypothetical protein